ncbi:MAG: ABC transporter permease [Saccharolobus sp.]
MIDRILALYEREMKRFFRSRYMWIMILVQPIMWIVFFGSSFSQVPKEFLQTFFHTNNYIAFIVPGELSVSMMMVGSFSSMSLIQDKRLGYLRRILVTPTRKFEIFYAKVLGGMTRGIIQVPIMLLASLVLGVQYSVDWIGLLEWIIGLIFVGIGFSSLYGIITANTSDWQAPGVVSNLLNLPLMFSSTALFPEEFFPSWLKAISNVNPLTYAAELGRDSLLYGDPPNPLYLIYLVAFGIIMLILGTIIIEKYLTAD